MFSEFLLLVLVIVAAHLMIDLHRRGAWGAPIHCGIGGLAMGYATCYLCSCLALPVLGLAVALFSGLLFYLGTEKRTATGARRGLYKLEFAAVRV